MTARAAPRSTLRRARRWNGLKRRLVTRAAGPAAMVADHDARYGERYEPTRRARHAVYFADLMRRRGVEHLHVHFANRATHAALFIHAADGSALFLHGARAGFSRRSGKRRPVARDVRAGIVRGGGQRLEPPRAHRTLPGRRGKNPPRLQRSAARPLAAATCSQAGVWPPARFSAWDGWWNSRGSLTSSTRARVCRRPGSTSNAKSRAKVRCGARWRT